MPNVNVWVKPKVGAKAVNHSLPQQSQPQRFERDGKCYTLNRVSSGRAITRAEYLKGKTAWANWFDIVRNGGDDPYKIRQQYRVEQIGGGK